ncbi:hypothetical protein FMN63_24955 [Stappia sp. BW2]|uniref:hypothetical protein n=1 Tax=Stappia sp. BW2 TaxID=2592622 RepID=UPI0011DE71FE|nr:hypothetical protein [Stappia sp. BW2]TYC65635.1 hypothetical protein FMN63_24955 [Stappia sp. BW2]
MKADFNPFELIWWSIGSLGFASLVIALLLGAFALLYPIAARYAMRDQLPRDQFLDWDRPSRRRK